MPQARLAWDLAHAAAGARIGNRWNGPPKMNGKRIDPFLTPPRNDSAVMGMVVIIAVTLIIIGIIFSYSDEPKASNANMESRAVRPDPEVLPRGSFPAPVEGGVTVPVPHSTQCTGQAQLACGREPCFGPQRTPRSGHSTSQTEHSCLLSFLRSCCFINPSLEYVEALSWTPGERG